MGSNSARNATYLLILGLLVGLGYLVKRKVDENKLATSSLESTPSTLSNSPALSDTSYSLSTSANPASMHYDSTHNSLDGKIVSGNRPTSYNEKSMKGKAKHESVAANSMMDDNALSTAEPLSVAAASPKVTSKGIHKKAVGTVSHSKSVKRTFATKNAKKDNATAKGDFEVVAGTFASPDNAKALVVKLKKLGYARAEAIKVDNSMNTQVVAGKYQYKGGAEAAVRTLKKDKIDALVKKKLSVLLKAETVTSTGNQAAF